MIAVIGLPGSVHHKWARFHDKKRAEEWLDLHSREISRRGLGHPPTDILSEKRAARVRFRDGTKVYPVSDLYLLG